MKRATQDPYRQDKLLRTAAGLLRRGLSREHVADTLEQSGADRLEAEKVATFMSKLHHEALREAASRDMARGFLLLATGAFLTFVSFFVVELEGWSYVFAAAALLGLFWTARAFLLVSGQR